jgi:lipopolysaccharide assembly protein A
VSTEPQSTSAPPAQPQPPPGSQVPGSQVPGSQVPGSQVPGSQVPEPQVPDHVIKHTRTSGLWVAVAFFAVILLLLLIFILQNGRTADIAYFGAHGHLPLGVALLLAAVCGALLVVLAGVARMAQLRTTARRHRRADARRAPASSASADPRG